MSVFSGGVRGKEREQQSPLLGPRVDQFLVVNQRSFRKKKKENQSSFITNHAFLAARFHGLKPTLANIVTRANALRSPRFELNDCETKNRKEKGEGQGLFRERPRMRTESNHTLHDKKERKEKRSFALGVHVFTSRTLFRAFLVQDAVSAFAADDDISGTKHDFGAAVCDGRGQACGLVGEWQFAETEPTRRDRPTEGERSGRTSAVVRHTSRARVLVIHISTVHDASHTDDGGGLKLARCANDLVEPPPPSLRGSKKKRAPKKSQTETRKMAFVSASQRLVDLHTTRRARRGERVRVGDGER